VRHEGLEHEPREQRVGDDRGRMICRAVPAGGGDGVAVGVRDRR
jgi:hypothetical protein